MAYLALVRHGESEWNAKGLWTGLVDIELSKKGREEAKKAATLIKDINFDTTYTSVLRRAIETLDEMKKILEAESVPVHKDKALNERDYGDLTGKNKWKIKEEYGQKQFLKWRRSWDYPIPNGETLKDVYNRVIPYYKDHILPELKKGKNVLVSAHGNSLRTLIKYLDHVSDKEIPKLEIELGQVYLYQVNQKGDVTSKEIRG